MNVRYSEIIIREMGRNKLEIDASGRYGYLERLTIREKKGIFCTFSSTCKRKDKN